MRRISTVWAGALCLVLPALALAGDAEAEELRSQAAKMLEVEQDADKALELIWAAQDAEPTDRVLINKIELFYGSLLQVQLGLLDQAKTIYDRIIRGLAGVDELRLKQVKAVAMHRKGTLTYAKTRDTEAAFNLFVAANHAFPRATTSHAASQMSYRMALDGTRNATMRKKLLEQAHLLAEEAVKYAQSEFAGSATELAKESAKFNLQLAIVKHTSDDPEGALDVYGEISPDSFGDDEVVYLRAVWAAQQGEPETAIEILEQFMSTRASGLSRNRLRSYVSSEAEFGPYLDSPRWAELLKEESARVSRALVRKIERREAERQARRLPPKPVQTPIGLPSPEPVASESPTVSAPPSSPVATAAPSPSTSPDEGANADADGRSPIPMIVAVVALIVVVVVRVGLKKLGPK